MKLDPDCIRDVLIEIEKCPYNEVLTITDLSSSIENFTEEEINYTCLKLQEGGFIEAITMSMLRQPLPCIKQINCLTYYGHQLLETIRPETVWSQTKSTLGKLGAFSIEIIVQIASNVITNLLNNQF